ncbi:MAG: hypothetical protein V1798_02220 [Pseudomonadota bacterium]
MRYLFSGFAVLLALVSSAARAETVYVPLTNKYHSPLSTGAVLMAQRACTPLTKQYAKDDGRYDARPENSDFAIDLHSSGQDFKRSSSAKYMATVLLRCGLYFWAQPMVRDAAGPRWVQYDVATDLPVKIDPRTHVLVIDVPELLPNNPAYGFLPPRARFLVDAKPLTAKPDHLFFGWGDYYMMKFTMRTGLVTESIHWGPTVKKDAYTRWITFPSSAPRS